MPAGLAPAPPLRCYAAPAVVEDLADVGADFADPQAIALPARLSFADTRFVGELAVGGLLALARRAKRTGQPFQVCLVRNSQPYRTLRLKRLLGECVVENVANGVWNLSA